MNEFIIKNGFRSQGNSEITGSLSTFATSSTATLLTLGASGSTSTTLTYTNRVPTLALTSNTNGPSSGGTGPDYLLTLNKVGSDGGPKVGIQISNAGVNSAILAYRAGAPSYLDMGFLIANNQILTLTSAQNVGIGTTSPSSKLHVLGSGTTSATTALLVQNSNTSASLVVNDNGAVAIGQSTPFSFAGNNSLTVNGIVYTSTAGGTSTPALYIGDSGAGAGRGFYGVNQGIGVSTNNATSMYFRGSPNLGSSNYPRIGINVDPTSVLDIRSDFTSSNLLNVSSSIGTVMFISGSGNVGIGTGTPAASLQVGNGTTSTNSLYVGGSVSTTQTIGFAVNGNTIYHGLTSNANSGEFRIGAGFNGGGHYLVFSSGDNTERMRITSGGNILIGTTTDAGFKLDVNGSFRTSNQVLFRSTAGYQGFRSDGLYSAFGYNTNEENNVVLKVGFAVGTSVNTLLKVDNTANSTASGPTTVLLDLLANSSQTANLLQWRNSSGTILGVINNIGNVGLGISTPTSRLSISGSAGTGSAIYAYKSGSTVLDIQGSQGQLFSVVDALSGSLMSVNDVSGLPILEVFSDDRVVMGTYGAPALIVTGSNTVISGSLDVSGSARITNGLTVTGSFTITGSQVISGSLRGNVSALTIASTTASVDMSTNNFFTLALVNGANTHINPTNINPGQTINIRVNQGSAGTGTVSFPSFVDQPSGSLYTGSAVANAIDIVTMISFDSTTVFVSSVRNMI